MITKLQLEKALSLVIGVSVPPCDTQNQDDAVRLLERMIATQEEIADYQESQSLLQRRLQAITQ